MRARLRAGRRLAEVILAVHGVMLAWIAAAAEIDVYGRLNVTLQNSDEAAEEQVELQSNSSRVGVKGEEALNGGLEAIYQFEWGIDPDGQSGDDNISARNQFVGLTGDFGTVKVGRHDLDSLLSVGVDHALGEGTRLFGFYTTGDIGGTSESNDYIAIGIEHKF